MELTEQASGAFEVIVRDCCARHVEARIEVEEVCESGRHRLSVRYPSADGGNVRLGLAYTEDRAALEVLRARLQRRLAEIKEKASSPA